MDIFLELLGAARAVPDWIYLALIPALLVLCTAVLLILRRGKLFFCFAVALGCVGVFFAACEGSAEAVAYAALFSLLSLLLRLLFFLPKREKQTREERIYGKFREELSAPSPLPQKTAAPPKVCCYEEAPAAQSDVRLGHVAALIAKLKKEKLAAADRLEVDVLSHTVEGCRGRALTEAERDTLNDCLASVLRLTAKYKL